jgi:hypothetical protein
MTLYEMQNELMDAVFESIKEHFENNEGEMTEDHYNNAIDDIRHSEFDYKCSNLYQDEVDKLLCEYGFDNAIKLYYDEYHCLEKITSLALLYNIISLTVETTYDDYITWANK